MEINCDKSNVCEVIRALILSGPVPITIKIDNGVEFTLSEKDAAPITEKTNNDEEENELGPIIFGGYDSEVKVCLDRFGTLCKVSIMNGEEEIYEQPCFRRQKASCTSRCIDFRISDDNTVLYTCMGSYHIKLVPINYENKRDIFPKY